MPDEDFHNFRMGTFCQKFDSCYEREINKQVLEMVAKENLHNKETVSIQTPDGIKPSMVSDIWGDSNQVLIGKMLYHIDADWTN